MVVVLNIDIVITRRAVFFCDICQEGWTNVGTKNPATDCQDVNECTINNGGCDPLAKCNNIPGGRTCGDCPHGYAGTGDNPAVPCTDINECLLANGGCDENVQCVNTPGSFHCPPCPPGFKGISTFPGGCQSKKPASQLARERNPDRVAKETAQETAQETVKTVTETRRRMRELKGETKKREKRMRRMDALDKQLHKIHWKWKLQQEGEEAVAHELVKREVEQILDEARDEVRRIYDRAGVKIN